MNKRKKKFIENKREYWAIKNKPITKWCYVQTIILAVDRTTFEVIKIFYGTKELEYAINSRVSLKNEVTQASKGTLNKLINGWVIITFTKNEWEELITPEDVDAKIMDRLLTPTLKKMIKRLNKNIDKFTKFEQEKIMRLIHVIENPNVSNFHSMEIPELI